MTLYNHMCSSYQTHCAHLQNRHELTALTEIRELKCSTDSIYQFFQPSAHLTLYLAETQDYLSPDIIHFQFPKYTSTPLLYQSQMFVLMFTCRLLAPNY